MAGAAPSSQYEASPSSHTGVSANKGDYSPPFAHDNYLNVCTRLLVIVRAERKLEQIWYVHIFEFQIC